MAEIMLGWTFCLGGARRSFALSGRGLYLNFDPGVTHIAPLCVSPLATFCRAFGARFLYFPLLVRRFKKSISTNCDRFSGLAKYALPFVIAVICFTKSTR